MTILYNQYTGSQRQQVDSVLFGILTPLDSKAVLPIILVRLSQCTIKKEKVIHMSSRARDGKCFKCVFLVKAWKSFGRILRG